MKCPICQAEISDGAQFCPKCGTKISQDNWQQTPQPAQENVRVVYTQTPQQSSSNSALYAIVGFLAAAVIGLGIWMFVRSSGDKKEQPTQIAQIAQSAQPAQPAQPAQSAQSAQSAQPAAAPVPAPQRTYTIQGNHRMRGSISNYPITLEFYVSGTQVSGTYYYHSQGSSHRMTVSGYIDGQYMVLEEYAPDGLNTGYFSGSFNGYRYAGSFTNYQKQKTHSFSVNEI